MKSTHWHSLVGFLCHRLTIFWHKSPNAVTTSRLAAWINTLLKLQFFLILVQKLFHLRIYLYRSAGPRLQFKAVALIIRVVWGEAEGDVQTISSPLISKTPVSDKNKPPLCSENPVSPKSRIYPLSHSASTRPVIFFLKLLPTMLLL